MLHCTLSKVSKGMTTIKAFMTVFENHSHNKVTYDIVEIASKLIWLHLHFEWTKVSKNALKSLIWKPEACSKRVLPDRSILI